METTSSQTGHIAILILGYGNLQVFLAIITFCYGFMVIVRGKNVNSLTREVKLTDTCKYVKECQNSCDDQW